VWRCDVTRGSCRLALRCSLQVSTMNDTYDKTQDPRSCTYVRACFLFQHCNFHVSVVVAFMLVHATLQITDANARYTLVRTY
jgi:hypothetical protein